MTGRRRRCRCGSWSCVRPGRPRIPASALPHARRAHRPGRPRGPAGAPRRSPPGGRARGGPLRLRTFLRRGLACRILAASALAVKFTLDPQTRHHPIDPRDRGRRPPPAGGTGSWPPKTSSCPLPQTQFPKLSTPTCVAQSVNAAAMIFTRVDYSISS